MPKYPVAKVDGKEIPWDPSQLRKIREHPCFSEKAMHVFGRIHLPVAPKCNIQCNYCIRDFDCVNESRPGVSSQVLTSQEAIARATEVLKKYPNIKVVGIAGPGEPLFNGQTFETLQLIKERFPRLIRCISTNGLLLPEKIGDLDKLGVSNITVTLNAVDPNIGKKIYSFVNYHGKKYKGLEAAEILLENQLKGLKQALGRGMIVKVNTVFIPTINDKHIVEIAKTIEQMGVYMQNVIPLIPLNKFAYITPPTPEEKKSIQNECQKACETLKQMRHCRQCRADAIGKLGEDIQRFLFPTEK